MDVLESLQYLIKEVAHMVIAEDPCLQVLAKISLHETIYNVSGGWSRSLKVNCCLVREVSGKGKMK